MKVIFHKDVRGVGKRFDIKEVADGYATNFLLPQGVAVKATSVEVAKVEKIKATEIKKKQEEAAQLVKNLKKISEITLKIEAEANDKGHLFKGITKEMLAEALKKAEKIDLDPSYIELEKPLKETGDHKVSVKIGEHNGFFTVHIG